MSFKLSPMLTVVFLAALVLGACGSDDDEGSAVSRPDRLAVATTYADLALASYDASIDSTRTMQKSLDRLVAKPSAGTLKSARAAWLAARDDYILTEPFRFYGGPIDDPEDGPEGKINAWPMDEAYVDYVEGDPDAGIVNGTEGFREITAQALREANEEGGETNVSTG